MTPSEFSKFEPLSWLVVFTTTTTMPWLDRVLPGRFKHVMAFGWVEAAKVFVHYDVQFGRTRVMALPEPEGLDLIAFRLGGDSGAGALRMPADKNARWNARVGFWCVPAIKHLLGLRSGALRPDRLWRDCLASGAEVIHDVRRAEAAALPAERAGSAGAEGGGERQDFVDPGPPAD